MMRFQIFFQFDWTCSSCSFQKILWQKRKKIGLQEISEKRKSLSLQRSNFLFMAGCLSNLLKKHKNQMLCFLIVCEGFFLSFSLQQIFPPLSGWPPKPLPPQRKIKLTLTVCTFYLSTTYCFSCFLS